MSPLRVIVCVWLITFVGKEFYNVERQFCCACVLDVPVFQLICACSQRDRTALVDAMDAYEGRTAVSRELFKVSTESTQAVV